MGGVIPKLCSLFGGFSDFLFCLGVWVSRFGGFPVCVVWVCCSWFSIYLCDLWFTCYFVDFGRFGGLSGFCCFWLVLFACLLDFVVVTRFWVLFWILLFLPFWITLRV